MWKFFLKCFRPDRDETVMLEEAVMPGPEETTLPTEIAMPEDTGAPKDTTFPTEIAMSEDTATPKDTAAPKETTPKETAVPEATSMPEMLQNTHDTSARFRVLILGPANAGKTTLLERLTQSPAGAAIVYRNGQRVISHFSHFS
jgi:hypothetical protein